MRLYLTSLYILAFAGMVLLQPGCNKENQAPSCMITDPEDGEKIPHGTQVNISVDAIDNDGVVYGVDFYIDNSNIGLSNLHPFSYQWNTLTYEIGSHTIRATAKDDSWNLKSDEKTVVLTEGVPVADFTVPQTSISLDSSAQFYNRSINNPTSWFWDFGEEGTSNLPDPSHIYNALGTYTVSLTVSNSFGSDTKIKTGYITVTPPLKDYDGNVYQTVQIGDQLWMKENLKTTYYSDGTALIDGTGVGNISGDYTTKYHFAYNDDESYVDTYGRLYTWAAVMNGTSGSDTNPSGVQGVCPDGWHVPSDEEWIELEMYLGMTEQQARTTEWRGSEEGRKLKESGYRHWWGFASYYYLGTNESGFTALPGGSRWYNESFDDVTYRANFWSATESMGSFAWCRRLYNNKFRVYRYDDYKSRGYSVRCVKDEEE